MLSVTTSLECDVTIRFTLSPVSVGRSSMAEHRTVTAAHEGSSPFDPPKSLPIVDCRMPIGRFLELPIPCGARRLAPIGNRQSAIVNHQCLGSCGREVRHLVVNQADDGSSPFSSAMRQ